MAPINSAAWLPFKSAKQLQLGPAPYTPPRSGQIVLKNSAVAINQVDWAKQLAGDLALSYIRYPFILGGDVAGTVLEVGPDVKRFHVGDRVLANAAAIVPASNNPAEGAFQQFTVIREHLAAPLPDAITYEQGCVLPLCLSTAAYGLFHSDFLALDMPTMPPLATDNPRTVLITAGASSVGSSAVQLAVAAGYEVLSTASPRNFGYVEKLGAARVFDYHSPTLVKDILSALRGRSLVGAYSIGAGATQTCLTVLRRHPGPTRKSIALAGGDVPVEWLKTYVGTARLIASMMWSMGRTAVASYLSGVQVKFVDGKDLCDAEGVVGRVYREFVPRALAERHLVPAPEPLVVGSGLDKIQEAMDIHQKGVSAQKIVVSL